MSNSKTTLKELLEHMEDLTQKGLFKGTTFDQTFDTYIDKMLKEENPENIKNAIEFLNTDPSIGTLNISEMIESLESKLNFMAQVQ